MSTTVVLDPEIMTAAANFVDTPGQWSQDIYDDGVRAYAHGAVLRQSCTTGDAQMWSFVMGQRGLTEAWNDDNKQTAEGVSTVLRALAVDVSHKDMEFVFGKSWEMVRDFVRLVASLPVGNIVEIAEQAESLPVEAVTPARSIAEQEKRNSCTHLAFMAALCSIGERGGLQVIECVGSAVTAISLTDLVCDDGPLYPEMYAAMIDPFVQADLLNSNGTVKDRTVIDG